jgi:hypothetical protein
MSGTRCVYYAAQIELHRDPAIEARLVGEHAARLTVAAATHPAAAATQPVPTSAAELTASSDPAWLIVAREARATTFLIEDETGRAVIDPAPSSSAGATAGPATAKFELEPAPPVELARAALTEGQRELLTRHHLLDLLDAAAGGHPVRLRYREATIAVGEAIAVFGAGTREPDPDAAPGDHYRGDAPTRLRLASTARRPLAISTDC